MTAVRHGFHQTRGFATHVAEAGDGPPLLLLHGWPEFWATWEPMFERLSDRWRLIAPDFRGFGESGNPDSGRTDRAGPDALADDIVALLDALGLDRVGVVGHDVGSFVMHSLGQRHADRLTGLFYFNCPTQSVGARWRAPEHIREIWYQTFHQMPYAAALVGATREGCRAHIGHFLRHWCHRKDAFDDRLERWVDNFMRPGNLQGGFNWYVSINAWRLAVMAGEVPPPPKIPVPTRVLWGRHDPVLRSAWSDVVPDHFAEVEIGFAEESGHFVHVEQPDLAATEIDRFFRRTGMAGA